MPKSPRRPPQLRGRIFRGSAAISRGLLTPQRPAQLGVAAALS
ncbi:hypothetical protein [Micromonospora avicenniae]